MKYTVFILLFSFAFPARSMELALLKSRYDFLGSILANQIIKNNELSQDAQPEIDMHAQYPAIIYEGEKVPLISFSKIQQTLCEWNPLDRKNRIMLIGSLILPLYEIGSFEINALYEIGKFTVIPLSVLKQIGLQFPLNFFVYKYVSQRNNDIRKKIVVGTGYIIANAVIGYKWLKALNDIQSQK